MPGGKTKTTTKRKNTKKKTTTRKPAAKKDELKELKKMVRSEEALMKSELNYFKGLSITITILIVCVFFAFGSLFTAMYLETKAMNAILMEYFLNEGYPVISEKVETSSVEDPMTEPVEIEWLSFSKYGVEVSFPNSWTYLDKPYQEELHFYADGVVRLPGNGDMGDVYVQVLDKTEVDEVMASDRVVSKSQSFLVGEYVAEKAMYQGDEKLSEFVLIRTNDIEVNYRVMFDSSEALDIMDQLLQKMEIE